MNKANLQSIQDEIISSFNKDYNDFISYLERETNPDIQEFLEKYLDWHLNKKTMLYRMFKDVIYQDDNYIWSSLVSFVGNYFKDDSSFVIQWMTVDCEDFENNVPTDNKEDMFAFPVLISDQDNGTQNVREIIDAMKQYEINESLWEKYYNEEVE